MRLKQWPIYSLKNKMIIGKFHADKDSAPAPVVPAVVAWNDAVQTPFFILDTGFSGELAVTEEVGRELGLNFDTVMKLKTATGEVQEFPAATAYSEMEGRSLFVTVIKTKGKALLGISFLEKFSYKATVDCKNKLVELEIVS